MEIKKAIGKIGEMKSWFFEKNKIGKSLDSQKEKKKPSKSEMKEEIQRIPQKCNGLWDHSEQLYANASDNLEEKDQFLETRSSLG